MDNKVMNICKLDVFAAFSDEIRQKIANSTVSPRPGFRMVELTDYVLYCAQLLKNNGFPVETDYGAVERFMWQAGPGIVLALQGYSNSGGYWRYEDNKGYLDFKFNVEK